MARKTRQAAKAPQECRATRAVPVPAEVSLGARTPTAAVFPGRPASTAKDAVKVPFVLLEPNAKHVWLTGEFNAWSPDRILMERQGSGYWKTAVELTPGRYEYKFIVDGEWIPDPLAHQNVTNLHGTLNSVVEVRV